MGLFFIAIYVYFIMIGYLKIISKALSQWYNMLKDNLTKLRSLKSNKTTIPKFKPSFDTTRIRTVLQTFEDTSKVACQLFDSDSDTTIADNSANCIVWKHRKDFINASYKEIPQDLGTTVNTVHGEGMPIGIGTTRVGWHDDYGKFHSFELPDVYHIPNSCTNVLGVPEFSRILGDSQREGTRINSSAKSLIFSWDDHKFVRHFKYPAS